MNNNNVFCLSKETFRLFCTQNKTKKVSEKYKITKKGKVLHSRAKEKNHSLIKNLMSIHFDIIH